MKRHAWKEQEAERDTAGAASTLEAALEWWAGAMEDDDCSSTGNDRPDQWIMQQLVQVPYSYSCRRVRQPPVQSILTTKSTYERHAI
jgi:hypothetical protein